ncbi:peptidylprolyl isomerase [Candidatus Pelagibacter sp.]|nr:peptidylprolyl isomerase [Candidatus Pelagibacter sp.]
MKKNLIFWTIYLILSSSNVIALENKIIIKIDNEIITSLDIDREIKYLSTLNPSIKSLSKDRLRLIGKNSLIKEKIKEKEILKYMKEINLDQKFLKELIKDRYVKLNFNTENDFLEYLKFNQINMGEIEKKFSIEAIWNQLIYSKFSSQVKINKIDLEKKIKERNNLTNKSYLLSEIFFNINDRTKLQKKYNEIKQVIENESFESAAVTYSRSDSATVGGKLGWINENSLNNNIRANLAKLNKENFTKPIFISSGYLILKINDIKLEKKKFDKNIELKKSINYETNQQLSQFSINYFKKIKKNIIINEL